MLANEIFLQNALRKEFSCPIRGLDRFAENSNISWTQPNILSSKPDRRNTADAPPFTLRVGRSAVPSVSDR